MKILFTVLGLFLLTNTEVQQSENHKKILIVQDMDHHDVILQAETFKNILQTAFNYTIEIISSSDEKKWHEYDFQFSDYDLIVTSSLGFENLPKEPLDQLEEFIENGGGLVVVHQGVGSYEEHPKFQELD
mgnify:CR=1 FL=1